MGKNKKKSNSNKPQNQSAPVGGMSIKHVAEKIKNKQNKDEGQESEKSANTSSESVKLSTGKKSEVSFETIEHNIEEKAMEQEQITHKPEEKAMEQEQITHNNEEKAMEQEPMRGVEENPVTSDQSKESEDIAQYVKNPEQSEEKTAQEEEKPTRLEEPEQNEEKTTLKRDKPIKKKEISSRNPKNKENNKPNKGKKCKDIKTEENTSETKQTTNLKEESMEDDDESWDNQDNCGRFDNLNIKSKEDDEGLPSNTYFSYLNPDAPAWPTSPETNKAVSDTIPDKHYNDCNEYKGKNSPEENWRSETSKNDKYYSSQDGYKGKNYNKRPTWYDNMRNENNEKIDDGYKEFERAFNKVEKDLDKYEYKKIVEQQADLFAMGKDYSLAHCVAEDMGMGSGIAVQFRRDFKRVDELLNQKEKQGGMALLEVDGRFVYYLVTKRESSGKPTYEKFFLSLKKWRDHVQQHEVKKLAIPRIGCGLDRLEWDKVKYMMEYLFKDVDTEIVVCNFQQAEESGPSRVSNCKVVNVDYSIAAIETGTLILYLASEDGYEDDVIKELDKKFDILRDYKIAKRTVGECIRHDKSKRGYLIYGCVVRRKVKDELDFAALQNCVKAVQKANRKDMYGFVGIQAETIEKDSLINKKIVNILRNTLTKVDVYVCWPGDLKKYMPQR